MTAAYQASGVAKAPATTEYIVDWLEGSDPSRKLVVFAHHKDVLDYIETTVSRKYKGRLGTMRIDGSVPPAERALRVKKFQSNKTVRLALLSMTAAGVGLTLTAASDVVFAELHWTPGVLAQAEDRCHRIGQANSVNVAYCICKDEEASVDMCLWNMLGRKVSSLGRVVDGGKVRLNAVERDAGAPSDGKKRGTASVEEELSTFFASASSNSSGTKANKGPIVKGTIESFFKKQAKGESKKALPLVSAEKTPQPNAADCISLLDDENDESMSIGVNKKNPSEGVKEKNPLKGARLPNLVGTNPKRAALACHACTFVNKADVTACAVCKTSLSSRTQIHTTDDLEGTTQFWACRVCTFANGKELSSCEMCGEKRDPESNKNMDGKETSVSKEESSSSNQSNTSGMGHKQNHDDVVCEEYDFDKEWDEDDLAAIDRMTQSQNKISQSPNPSTPTHTPPQSAPKLNNSQSSVSEILSFSVSRNSGRIALHLSSQPLHVNFDIAEVLTKESAAFLEEANLLRTVSRSSVSPQNQDVSFDDGSVRQILAPLDDLLPPALVFNENLRTMCEELKQFVRHYLSLREVEKKALKESGEAITASSLKHTVAKLLVSTITGATDRYSGGARERAISNLKNNCASAEDMAVINGKRCAWCAKPFLCAEGATYCSQTCVEEGRVRRGGIYSSTKIREQLFALEHGVCTMCKVDAHALFCKIKSLHPAERLNLLLNAKWKLPKSRQAVDRLMSDPKESDFWQADHELAVAEGGGGTGLDNLRTLCTPCHMGETEKLMTRLKTKPAHSDEPAKDGLTQVDILSCFTKMQGGRGGKRGKRKRVAD
ncbi:hypothetical protein ACHAWF_015118 [Thalassiosira exigua]